VQTDIVWLSLVAGVVALVFAIIKTRWINRQEVGTEVMAEISGHIREGAMAFLRREYRVLGVFVLAVGVLLALGNAGPLSLVAVSFVVGAI